MRLPKLNRASDPPIRLSDTNGEEVAAMNARYAQGRLAMIAATVRRIGTVPTARERHAQESCGHARHVGACPACQRAQLTRWRQQLAHATAHLR
jgi:hypothetical protein